MLLWLTIHSTILFSQSQQKKNVSYPNGWSEQYGYLREGNHETLHGSFFLQNDKRSTVIKGKYQNGKKEGLWEYYHPASGVISVEASYTAGNPSGIWEYYNETGQTWMIYNFNHNEVILLEMDSRPETVQYSYSWPGIAGKKCIPEKAPVPLGPYDPLTYISIEIHRSEDTSPVSLLQEAVIQFTVDEYGKVTIFQVMHNNTSASARFQDILTEYRYLWIPAQKDDFLADIHVELRPKE
jgi:hypothetical protein